MKRKLYNFSALLSLLLFVGTVWWWTHSNGRIDEFTYQRQGVQSVHVWGTGGKFTIERTVYPGAIAPTNPHQVTFGSTAADAKATAETYKTASIGYMPFSFDQQPLANGKGAMVSRLIVPAWMLAAVFALPPALWIAPKLKRKKKPAKE